MSVAIRGVISKFKKVVPFEVSGTLGVRSARMTLLIIMIKSMFDNSH